MNGRADMLAALPGGRLLAEFSLWSADLVRMADDVARVDEYVDIYHADVADGHFSPAMLLFPDLIAQIRPLTDKPVHVHLMVTDAALLDQIDQFAEQIGKLGLLTTHGIPSASDEHATIEQGRGGVPAHRATGAQCLLRAGLSGLLNGSRKRTLNRRPGPESASQLCARIRARAVALPRRFP